MSADNPGDIAEEYRQHLKDVVEKIKNFGKQGWSREELAKAVEFFEEQTEIAEDFRWRFYLATETKDEYQERKGDY